MKPGQQLHIVNELYPYTVQFKEEPGGDKRGIKRTREPTPLESESSGQAASTNAANKKEKEMDAVPVSQAQASSVK